MSKTTLIYPGQMISSVVAEMSCLRPQAACLRANAARGFSLIELMIAITLGLLISIGLDTLFAATSKTNKVQDSMAQMQENGRYAVSRLNNDLRMIAHQRLNVSGFVSSAPSAAADPNGVTNPSIAADVYFATIYFPDYAPTGVGPPAGYPAQQWPLSQRYFLQGYECSTGTCTPAFPTGTANDLPAAGTTAGTRLNTGDILTMRYLNATGWSLNNGELTPACTGGTLSGITVTPAVGSPALNFTTNDLVMLVAGSSASIFQVTAAGGALAPKAIVPGATLSCNLFPSGVSLGDVVLYNFSQNFVTVTYYIKLDADPSVSGRVIPTLVRRQSTIDTPAGTAAIDQELVQGVEQLDFLIGIQRTTGMISYLTSDQVLGQSSLATCPPEPQQYTTNLPGVAEPGCLWRAVTSIEAHLLVDSVNNIYPLTPADQAFIYPNATGNSGTNAPLTAAVPGTSPSGLPIGSMLRREFVSLVSVRNYNP